MIKLDTPQQHGPVCTMQERDGGLRISCETKYRCHPRWVVLAVVKQSSVHGGSLGSAGDSNLGVRHPPAVDARRPANRNAFECLPDWPIRCMTAG